MVTVNGRYHGVLSPLRQTVVHRYLLPFGDVSDRYDDEPHLAPTVHLSDAAVGRGGVQHGRPGPAGLLLAQLRDAAEETAVIQCNVIRTTKVSLLVIQRTVITN